MTIYIEIIGIPIKIGDLLKLLVGTIYIEFLNILVATPRCPKFNQTKNLIGINY